jgi:glycine dehydrogenase subunit 1
MSTYTPHTDCELKSMISALGMSSLDELYKAVPKEFMLKKLDLPEGISQADAELELKTLSQKNKVYPVILKGAGSYYHYIPAVVRKMAERSEFITAYTPYQAEMSQGILQAIFEYQSMICFLTGMDVCNSSHYDGATAAAEAVLMCRERNRNKLVIAPFIKEDTIKVMKTYLYDVEIITAPQKDGLVDLDGLKKILDPTVMAIYLEQPASNGIIEQAEAIGEIAHSVGAKFIMNTYAMSLGLLKKPSECGADITVAEGQPFGLNMAFGGPYLGIMATTKAMQRKLPGRIVGETLDHDGRKAYVLTLQAREQHIRREKASSNICSNEAHCALTCAMYLATMGEEGLKKVASSCVSNAHYLQTGLSNIGLNKKYSAEFFNEFVTMTKGKSKEILDALDKANILGGNFINDDEILWCATEMVSVKDMDRVIAVIKEAIC